MPLSPAPPLQGRQEDKQTQTPPTRPPPPAQPPLTPRPDSSLHQNSHNKPKPREEGTDGGPPAKQGDRKRSKNDQGPDTDPLGPDRDPSLGPTPLPLGPPPPGPGPRRSPRLGSGGSQPDHDPEAPLEGEVEGGGHGHHPPPPPPPPPTNGHECGPKPQGPEGREGAEGPGEGARGAEGGEEDGHPPPPPPPTNGQEGSLLGAVACLLTKWEGHFDLLVQNIQDELEDYWKKLLIPQ